MNNKFAPGHFICLYIEIKNKQYLINGRRLTAMWSYSLSGTLQLDHCTIKKYKSTQCHSVLVHSV